jgi:hypothetical protein
VLVGTDRLQAFGIRSIAEDLDTSRGRSLPRLEWHGDPRAWHIGRSAMTAEPGQHGGNEQITSARSYDDFQLHFRYRIEKSSDAFMLRFRAAGPANASGYSTLIGAAGGADAFAISRRGPIPIVLAHSGDDAEIYAQARAPRVLRLVNASDVITAAIRPYPAWNDYVLSVSGNQIAQAINGVLINQAADNDSDNRELRGVIALQLTSLLKGRVEITDVQITPVTWPYLWTTRFASHPHPALASLSSEETRLLTRGKQIFQTRCSVCHADPNSGAPSPQTLAQYPAALITDALTNGAMRDIAKGLDDDAKAAVATYLTTDWIESHDAAH